MTKSLLALAAALSVSAAFAAQAQPIMTLPAKPETVRVAATAPAETEAAPVDAAPVAPAAKPPGYRSASYKGGEGATWKTGRDAYGFSGTYGGCRYVGHAGRGGFSIDRVCR